MATQEPGSNPPFKTGNAESRDGMPAGPGTTGWGTDKAATCSVRPERADADETQCFAGHAARAARRAFQFLALISLLFLTPPALAEKYELPLFVSNTTSGQQGVVRILNHSDESGSVSIVAIDDAGTRSSAATLALGALAGVNLDAVDLETGSATKGVTGGIGSIQGSVRLEFDTELAVQLLAYLRTADGTLSVLHAEVSPATSAENGRHGYLVPTFNAAQEMSQMSQLRLVNSTQMAATVTIEGRDDAGAEATGGNVELTLPAGGATTLTAQRLEAGGTGLTGQLGTGTGQWRLRISSDQLIEVISLVESSTGHLANLSTPGRGVMEPPPDTSPRFEEASAPGDQTYTADTAITTLTLPEATGGDGTLTYTLTPRVPGLAFDAATRQLSGTPTTANTHNMTYTATDEDGDTNALSFTITVQAPDDGMTVAEGDCYVSLRVSPGESCTYPGTDSAFTVDADGRGRFLVVSSARAINLNKVTYRGTFYDFRASHQGDGVWRIDRIDGSTEAPATPPSGGGGEEPEDAMPSFAADAGPGDQAYTADTAITTLTLPQATGGNGTLTYSLSPDVPGLTFDAATRQLTGTPTTAATHNMTYTATDEDGDTDTLPFTITVEAAKEEMPVEPDPNLPVASACSDGTYVDNPGSNSALVSDCTALVAVARALVGNADLPDDHALRQWGRGAQTKLPSWAGIQVNEGRVSVIQLRSSQLEGPIPSELGRLTALTRLWLGINEFTGAIPAEFDGLSNLRVLELGSNAISDISVLKNLPNLEQLWMIHNRIQDVSDLAELTRLRRLYLGWNQIEDISPLSGLTSLEYLGLQYTGRSDISALSGLTNLISLNLEGNQIDDISTLSGLTNLTWLRLSLNRIVDLLPLTGLTKLEELWLNDNEIEDISELAGMSSLTLLELRGNRLVDISTLAALTNLTWLDLSHNRIVDLSPLAGLNKLEQLKLNDNEVEDISALSGLSGLRNLRLESNGIMDISPLVSNSGLGEGTEINLSANPLSDESIDVHVEALKARGAIVLHPLRLVDDFPDSRLVQVFNDNVIVMEVEEDIRTRDVLNALPEYASDLYHWFEDEFDYLLFHSNLSQMPNGFPYFGTYYGVMNETEGTGRRIYFNNSFGSGGRLRGAIHFPSYRFLRSGPALHELLHAWANFVVPTAVGGHWGFSSANGQLGGFDIAEFMELGDDRYTAGSFGTFANGGNSLPYSPIELYLAGLALPSEVPDLWFAQDGKWLIENDSLVRTGKGYPIFTASDVRTHTIEDIISEGGERNPPMVERTHQRAAVILLINKDESPTSDALQTLSEDANWLAMQGDDGTRLYNYYEATGGRATLSLGDLSTFRKADPGAPTSLPASFGTPPPPTATMLDGTCREFDLP